MLHLPHQLIIPIQGVRPKEMKMHVHPQSTCELTNLAENRLADTAGEGEGPCAGSRREDLCPWQRS